MSHDQQQHAQHAQHAQQPQQQQKQRQILSLYYDMSIKVPPHEDEDLGAGLSDTITLRLRPYTTVGWIIEEVGRQRGLVTCMYVLRVKGKVVKRDEMNMAELDLRPDDEISVVDFLAPPEPSNHLLANDNTTSAAAATVSDGDGNGNGTVSGSSSNNKNNSNSNNNSNINARATPIGTTTVAAAHLYEDALQPGRPASRRRET